MNLQTRRMSRLVINHFPNNLYIKRKYSPSCLRIWKKIYSFSNGYELITQTTFKNNACFTIFEQFHNGESKKTNTSPNPTKNPNPSRNPNPPKTLTLPKTLILSKTLTHTQTLTLEVYYGEIPRWLILTSATNASLGSYDFRQ